MSAAEYMRHRLARAGVTTDLKGASFGDLCILAHETFGQETLDNWGMWSVVEPWLKAQA